MSATYYMSDELKNSKILIVDDTPENVEILGEILNGYKKQVALNGERALKLANGESKPDLILLDIMMPGMDGFEVCRRLKENEATRDIPVIFITAKSEVEDETRGLQLGAVDFIPKPISPPVVLARVKNHLELKMARQRLEGQNVELASRNKYITDSINYAKRIQNAILQSEEQLKELLPESMLFFSPKDILSGDFFWFGEVEGRIVFAVVDCTGHGVPGSMMSMVGNTLLNEIVKILKITDPGEILNHLDKRVVKELQKDINTTTFDGMDAAVCTYLPAHKKLLFAGAYRQLYYWQGSELFEIKGSKKSIGDTRKQVEYSSAIVDLETAADIYMFTDGFTDQNDLSDNKFGTIKLKELIAGLRKNSMIEQKEIIKKAFNDHRGSETQRDDVTLLATRLSPEQEIKVFSYKGPLDESKIASLSEELIRDIDGAINLQQADVISKVVRELLKNSCAYSDETVLLEGREFKVGSINVWLSSDSLKITTGNIIDENDFDRINSKISELNMLNEAELNSLKRVKLLTTKESRPQQPGIGFLEILLLAKSQIRVSNSQLNEQKSYIEFTITIETGD